MWISSMITARSTWLEVILPVDPPASRARAGRNRLPDELQT